MQGKRQGSLGSSSVRYVGGEWGGGPSCEMTMEVFRSLSPRDEAYRGTKTRTERNINLRLEE